jgi:hypothetical protein
MDEKTENEPNSLPEFRRIVEKGIRYAAQRFPESEAVRESLAGAAIVESNELNHLLEIVPPRQRGGVATIRYSPARVADLRREHRFPEWVVSATAERVILASAARWPLDEQEAVMLAAHRERRRRVPSSGTGPLSSD